MYPSLLQFATLYLQFLRESLPILSEDSSSSELFYAQDFHVTLRSLCLYFKPQFNNSAMCAGSEQRCNNIKDMSARIELNIDQSLSSPFSALSCAYYLVRTRKAHAVTQELDAHGKFIHTSRTCAVWMN